MASRISGVYKQRKSTQKSPKSRKKAKKAEPLGAAEDPCVGASSLGAGATQPAVLGQPESGDHDDVEDMLRQFDLDMSFGPCLGLSRMERWQRAERNGLKPPAYVKDVLERVGGEENCLWEGRV